MERAEQVSLISENDAYKIVVDCGSSLCRVGFVGADAPRSVFPTCLNSTQHGLPKEGSNCGKDSPFERGIVTDWDAMEMIWEHAFSNELRVDPKEHSVLLSDHQQSPKFNREKMAEIMFEKFNIEGLIISTSSLLSLYASGRLSGVVIESGQGGTYIASVYNGSLLTNGLERLDFGGRDVTDYLVELLRERGYSFSTLSEWEYVNQMKESLCYVAYDFEEERKSFATDASMEEVFTLPDGLTITLKDELIRACEVLFDPTLLFDPDKCHNKSSFRGTFAPVFDNMPLCGVHEALYKSIMQCDMDLRRTVLYDSILLSGGNTMFPNIQFRLLRELNKLFAPSARIRIRAPPERKSSTWIGGSIYASSADNWFRRGDYGEHGPTYVHKLLDS